MKYPIGIQTFSEIITQGYVYVDKTEHVYNLAHSGKYYFLSRPRRFGKSLLVSTLDAYFSGRKELFKGLAIEKLEQDWETFPVIRLDLSGQKFSSQAQFNESMDRIMYAAEQRLGLKTEENSDPTFRFGDLLLSAYKSTGKPVVILIDEYDKPIMDNIDNPGLLDYCRFALQSVYGVMKSNDAIIRMGFLTGVSKIGHLSVFSGLNNLMDISLFEQYNDICGISETELHQYFDEEIYVFADKLKVSKDECYARLKAQYDGYRFCEDAVDGIYSPFSLLNALYSKKLNDYWFATGTPSFLVKVIKQTSFDLTSIADQQVDSTLMANPDSIFANPVPLLFQSGYLTIKDYNADGDFYDLKFPNLEVKKGFFNYLLGFYAPMQGVAANTLIYKLRMSLVDGKSEYFMRQLSALFARTPYQIQGDAEKDFQYAMFIIVQLLGIDVQAEYQTSDGRIDLLIRTDKYIYIIEIKLGGTVDEAVKQIEEKDYGAPFAADPRQIIKIGVNFDKSTRKIVDWRVIVCD